MFAKSTFKSKCRRWGLVAMLLVASAIITEGSAQAGWGVGWGYAAPPVVAYRPVVRAYRPVVRPVVRAYRTVAPVVAAPVVAYRAVAPVRVYRPAVTVAPYVPVPAVSYRSGYYSSGYRGYGYGGVSVNVGYGVAPVGYIGY